MDRLLIIGSACVDVVIRVDALPKTGDDLQPESQRFSVGGCGWNVFRAARKAGADPVFLAPVGTGVYGDMVARTLEAAGVPVLARPAEENGCCYCLVEANGERTFLSVRGAEYRIRREWLDALAGPFSLAYVCGMELQEPEGDNILDWLEAHPETRAFYAPGPRGILMDRERQARMLNLRPILHLNGPEALALSGADTPEAAAETLGKCTGQSVIVTLGGDGCLCRTPEGEVLTAPAVPVTVADTIGAGDTHAGVMLACIHQGIPLSRALTLANAAAAETVSRHGAAV